MTSHTHRETQRQTTHKFRHRTTRHTDKRLAHIKIVARRLVTYTQRSSKRQIASQLIHAWSVLSVSIITQMSIMKSLGMNLMQVSDRMGETFFVRRQKRMFAGKYLRKELSVWGRVKRKVFPFQSTLRLTRSSKPVLSPFNYKNKASRLKDKLTRCHATVISVTPRAIIGATNQWTSALWIVVTVTISINTWVFFCTAPIVNTHASQACEEIGSNIKSKTTYPPYICSLVSTFRGRLWWGPVVRLVVMVGPGP